MKLKSLLLSVTVLAVCGVFGTTVEDPFADATVWFKGIKDVNSDGVLQADDLLSAVGTAKPWSSIEIHNSPVVTNELVSFPYRGGRRYLKTLYFPQAVTVTNEETGAGYGYISTAILNNFTPNANVTTNNYTVAIRFRPDNEQYHAGYCWIFNWGYNNQMSGWNLGLSRYGYTSNRVFKDNSRTNLVSYRTYTPSFFKNGQAANLFANCGGQVYGNRWHDLIITVDGNNHKLRYVLCRQPWNDPDMTANMASDNGGQMTYSNEVEMTVGVGTNFTPAATMILGSEATSANRVCYPDNNQNGNITKSYRGSIHQLAFWNRAMSFEEMKRALAYPRGDVVRVGVQNGTTSEFRGGDAYGDDDREWTLPASYSAGTSATVTFNADRTGECDMPQILRIWGTSDSATGDLSVSINGKDQGKHTISPAHASQWFIKPNVLVDGTNTLTVARTDAGTGAVKVDALALGGSWQIGYKDGRYTEFCHESSGKLPHEVLDGNTYSIRRVLFGSVPSAAGSIAETNMVYTFTVPQEFKGAHYGWTLAWKDNVNNAIHFPQWRLNGHLLDYTAAANGQYHSVDVPNAYFVDGVNTLEIFNAGSFTKGVYYALDYFQMMISVHNGSFLIIR